MKNPLLVSFGLILKSERSSIDISFGVMSKFENASRVPSSEHALSISMAINVKFSNLVALLEFCRIVGTRFDSDQEFMDRFVCVLEKLNDSDLKLLLNKCYRILLEIDHQENKVHRMQLAFRDYLKQERSFGRRSYVTRFATRDEIPEIQRKRAELLPSIGKNLTPDKLLRIYDVNSSIVTKVFKPTGEDLGFFILYPLTKEGVDYKISNCKLGCEKRIEVEHIASSFHDANGIWIAMIAGSEGSKGRINSGMVINAMFEVCAPLFSNQSIECILTKAVSNEGRAFLNRRGFESLLTNDNQRCDTSIASVTQDWLERNGLKTVPHSFS